MQTDWGGEYQKLSSFFTRIGIAHLVSCPHTHQQNGAAERKNPHIVEVGLALLAHSSMPLKFWDEAFSIAAFLINRLPSPVIDYASPIEKLFGTKPDYSFCFAPLVVRVGQIFVLTILTSFHFVLNNVLSLGIVLVIRVTNVLTYLLAGFTYLVMLSLTRQYFLLLTYTPMLALVRAEIALLPSHLLPSTSTGA